jgi:hypothetical protein
MPVKAKCGNKKGFRAIQSAEAAVAALFLRWRINAKIKAYGFYGSRRYFAMPGN